MAKAPNSPLLGFNNNVRHKARTFHIQTEDSGIKHPHIITHLFMDGGRILKSVKTSYAEHIGTDAMVETVKQMMKEQHKAMFMALRDGQFDHLVDEQLGRTGRKSQAPPGGSSAPVAKSAAPVAGPPADRIDIAVAVVPPPPHTTPSLAAALDAIAPRSEEAPATIAQPGAPVDAPDAGDTVQTDVSAVERAAALLDSAPSIPDAPTTPQLPTDVGSTPPPDARPPSFAPPASPPRAPSAAAPAVVPSPAPPMVQVPSPRPASVSPAARSRYAPARPASIFGQTRPKDPPSAFGEGLVSDKSLDEVILSYLAEDLAPRK